MNKHVQIKNLDASVHRILKIRAIEDGMSLSDYLRRELAKIANRPTNKEIFERLKQLPHVDLKVSPAELVREDRNNK